MYRSPKLFSANLPHFYCYNNVKNNLCDCVNNLYEINNIQQNEEWNFDVLTYLTELRMIL